MSWPGQPTTHKRRMAASLPLMAIKHARAARPARGLIVLLACMCAAAVLLCASLHPSSGPTDSSVTARLLAASTGADASANNSTRTASFVIAIATVHRPGTQSQYLPATLRSLSCALSTPPPSAQSAGMAANASSHAAADAHARDEQEPPLVLVVNTEVPASRHTAFAALEAAGGSSNSTAAASAGLQLQLRTMALRELHPALHSPAFVGNLTARITQDNLLHNLAGPERARFLAGLSDTDRDPADRLWWRAKEVLDAAFVLEAAAAHVQEAPASSPHNSSYVMFLQDDVRLAAGFLQTVGDFLNSQDGSSVDVLTLFSTGAAAAQARHAAPRRVAAGEHFGLVAVVFKPAVVRGLVARLRTAYADAPVDWLLGRFIMERGLRIWVMQPNLVQHEGMQSSLAGKTQPLRSATFVDTHC